MFSGKSDIHQKDTLSSASASSSSNPSLPSKKIDKKTQQKLNTRMLIHKKDTASSSFTFNPSLPSKRPTKKPPIEIEYGVATISRLLKIAGLTCKRAQ